MPPFDLDELTDVSRDFARRFLARFPALSSSCSVETFAGVPGKHLRIHIDSPAGSDRDVTIWMLNGTEPSLGFGNWHTHEDLHCEESLLDLLDAILRDQFVVCEDPDATPQPFSDVLDLREPDALLEELTWPRRGNRVRLATFSGRGDREVTLDDLNV